MYRRLKNILGVSFVIFAIVLSQIPMNAVQADGDSEAQTSGEVRTVTFNMNGGTFTGSYNGHDYDNPSVVLVLDENKAIETYPEDTYISYSGFETETGKWYKDRECLSEFNKDSLITEDTTLYKKWYSSADGFCISADGTVLYGYNGNAADVTIPGTVRVIGENAFSNMSGITSITLPANIEDIRANAFSGAGSAQGTITLLDGGSEQSASKCRLLEASYSNMQYQETANMLLANNANGGVMPAANGTDKINISYDTGLPNATVAAEQIDKGSKPAQPTEITINSSVQPLSKGAEYIINTVKYVFKGWYETSDYNGTEYTFNRGFDTDKTLYAKWDTDKKYTITFVKEAGAENYPDNITKSGGEPVGEQPTLKPVKTGYQFVGWYTTSGQGADPAAVWNGWNKIITEDINLYAGWQKIDVQLTFNYNGGTADGNPSTTVNLNSTSQTDAFVAMATKTYIYDGYEYEKVNDGSTEPRWYKDINGLVPFDMTETITSDLTLYLKWINTTPEGFTMNANQAVLYKYTNVNGVSTVKVPNTVTTITTGAFSEESLQNIGTIVLPAVIRTIQDGAFPESSKISKTITLKMADNSTTLVEIARQLEKKYTYLKYSSDGSSGGSSSDTDTIKVISSLNDINTIEGNNGVPSYAQFTVPGSLDGKRYTLNMDPGKNSNPLGTALKNKLGSNEAYPTGKIYYMEINLVNGYGNKETYVCSGGREHYTIIMPIPNVWAAYAANESDATKIFKVYTVDSATKSVLEEVEVAPAFYTSKAGIKCIEFHPLHFSEYALVYIGNGNSGNNNNNNNQGGTTGGGDSGSGGEGGGSSDGGSSSGNNNSSSGSSTSGQQPTVVNTSTVVTPVPDMTQTTQPTGTTPTGTGGSTSGNVGHVKDTTPKTGDILEYRTILECLFFSMGVLILLAGNKKKQEKYRSV